MIQRIQTVYLLVAALLSLLTAFLTIVTFVPEQGEAFCMTALHIQDANQAEITGFPVWTILVFDICAMLLSSIAIFGYKNRKKQMRTTRSAILANILTIVVAACAVYATMRSFNFTLQPGFALFTALLAPVSNYLAYKGIKHDEKLVRDADRIR